MYTLAQTFPTLTDPADPSNPHKIVPRPPYHYPLQTFRSPEGWHLEYLDNVQDFESSGSTPLPIPVVGLHGYTNGPFSWEGFMHMMSASKIRAICKSSFSHSGPFLWGLEHAEQNDVSHVNFDN